MLDEREPPEDKQKREAPDSAPTVVRPKESRTSPVPLEYVVPFRGDLEER